MTRRRDGVVVAGRVAAVFREAGLEIAAGADLAGRAGSAAGFGFETALGSGFDAGMRGDFGDFSLDTGG